MQNRKLEQELKLKQEIIDQLKYEQARKRQAKKYGSYHFQEVSDIISEEDDSLGGKKARDERKRMSVAPVFTHPLLTPSPI